MNMVLVITAMKVGLHTYVSLGKVMCISNLFSITKCPPGEMYPITFPPAMYDYICFPVTS